MANQVCYHIIISFILLQKVDPNERPWVIEKNEAKPKTPGGQVVAAPFRGNVALTFPVVHHVENMYCYKSVLALQ